MSTKNSPKCLCSLAQEGANLLAELALNAGHPSAEQLDKVNDHMRRVNVKTQRGHMAYAVAA